jgi:diguanylate cyclase (GGDEF)-like protein
MPQPGDVSQPQSSAEDSFLDLLVETLQGLDEPVRGQFLRQYFRTIAQIELTDAQANQHWDSILVRHRELSENLGKKVSLKTAIIDVLASSNFLRVPIMMEYDEFKKLRLNAATDPLTGLYNRRLFDESLEKELNRAKRYGHRLGVVLLDLHKLKEVNDRRGHLEGDHALQLAASTLRKTLRASDMAFRIGGDEFALLLPQTDSEQSTTLCRRIRSLYEGELRPIHLDVGVTLDFGVAVHPEDGEQKRSLLAVADERLYALKHAGRTTGPRTVSAEPREAARATPMTRVVPAPAESTPEIAATLKAPVPESATPPASAPPATRAPEPRKWERVSLAGTKAHAVLAEGQKNARVLDLSYGGVALLFLEDQEIPAQFNAVLNVPILPPVRVVLQKAYSMKTAEGHTRVGCAFVA